MSPTAGLDVVMKGKSLSLPGSNPSHPSQTNQFIDLDIPARNVMCTCRNKNSNQNIGLHDLIFGSNELKL